ncbi:hypothetical protein [Crossiella cryophila]|uniref:LppX_LprAFG lipoprotein n=1 Tax=Crossiella cryophila TaxID=43355 RepID=A0A7W7C7Z8_9PSEU|nr:hypothetical protein [Crossiella cryophila]MBB4674943.1 hypothetical protein [Crossiella cryophila]
MKPRRVRLIAAIIVFALLLVPLLGVLMSCARPGDAMPRSLSSAEAERLALVRFINYESRTATVRAAVPSAAGVLVLDGRVDFVEHIGYAAMRTEGRADASSAGLLQWNPEVLAFRAGTGQVAADPVPGNGWQVRPIQRAGNDLDTALNLLVNLAADRPDNAQLLQQSSARWLRADKVGDTVVDVFEGPQQPGKEATGRLRYWVAGDGRLHRLEARIGTSEQSALIDFRPNAAPITPIPAIRA